MHGEIERRAGIHEERVTVREGDCVFARLKGGDILVCDGGAGHDLPGVDLVVLSWNGWFNRHKDGLTVSKHTGRQVEQEPGIGHDMNVIKALCFAVFSHDVPLQDLYRSSYSVPIRAEPHKGLSSLAEEPCV
jgi:hypothetical protein